MDPVTMVLMGAAAAGGIISAVGGKKEISPEWLKKHFGADAVNEEMITLFNNILNSPYGQQVMTDAASQGSMFENALRSRIAETGLGAGEGGSSGASIFSEAAAGGATKSAIGQARAGIFQQTIPLAQQLVNARLNAYMGQPALGEPSAMSKFGSALGNAAAVGLMAGQPQKPVTVPEKPAAPSTGAAQGTSMLAMPNKFVQERMLSATGAGNVRPSRFRASLGGSF